MILPNVHVLIPRAWEYATLQNEPCRCDSGGITLDYLVGPDVMIIKVLIRAEGSAMRAAGAKSQGIHMAFRR